MDHDIDRRTFVTRTGAATGTLALTGCLGTGGDEEGNSDANETEDGGPPAVPEVEDPPDAVYVPTHRESMRMLEPIEAGDYTLAPMLSYPHPFWLVAGGDEAGIERVAPEEGRGVHVMFTLWDAGTGVVLPVDADAAIRVYRDGDRVGSPRSPWPMISQGMGFHFGDNVPLGDDGTYRVEVDLPPLSTRRSGELEGRFTERETAAFAFDYDRSFRESVFDVEYLDEEYWGERGALEPMARGDDESDSSADGDDERVPYSELPDVDAYPGTLLVDPDGERPAGTRDLPRSGDAAVLATLSDPGFRLADGDERYLLVSPRTPYNRVPLADMSLRATVERGGETVADADLVQTIDGEYDLHYGTSLADVEPGDTVTIAIERPPQVARHQGYETAFLEMPPVELAVPEGA